MKEFDKLVDIISQLREECPWDKEQTHESLSKHLIEEAYELLDSLAKLNNNNQESYRNLSSCLLYTSPSPRDKRQSRMPSSA